jgi:hypothetical protein
METHCSEITEGGIKALNKAGDELFFEADNVILATGIKPLKETG